MSNYPAGAPGGDITLIKTPLTVEMHHKTALAIEAFDKQALHNKEVNARLLKQREEIRQQAKEEGGTRPEEHRQHCRSVR